MIKDHIKHLFLYLSDIVGPKLPFSIYGSAMITSPNGKGVIIIGGTSRDYHPLKTMLELRSDLMEWAPMKQKNIFHRGYPFAIQIPNDLKP